MSWDNLWALLSPPGPMLGYRGQSGIDFGSIWGAKPPPSSAPKSKQSADTSTNCATQKRRDTLGGQTETNQDKPGHLAREGRRPLRFVCTLCYLNIQRTVLSPRTHHESALVETHRVLGGDALGGNQRRAPTQLAREESALQKATLACRLGPAGEAKARLMRAGPIAKAVWGSRILGIPSRRLCTLRVAAAKARGCFPQGASRGLSCLAHGAGWEKDLLIVVAELAVKTFVETVWAEVAPSAAPQLLRGRELAAAGFGAPWGSTYDGRRWDAEVVSPTFFAMRVRHAARGAIALEDFSRRGGLVAAWRAPLAWRPLSRLLGQTAGPGWCPHHKHTLRGLIGLVFWTQVRIKSWRDQLPEECQCCQ